MNNLPPEIHKFIGTDLPAMDGWCSPQKADALARSVIEIKPKVVVEIGVFAGRSLLVLALACRHNREGLVYGIDPWDTAASISGLENDVANYEWWKSKVDHESIYRQCVARCQQQGVNDRIILMRSTSAPIVPWL